MSNETRKILEDIRAEIYLIEKEEEFMNEYNSGYNSAIYDIINIINKHEKK